MPSESYKTTSFVKTPVLIVHGELDTVLEPKYFDESCRLLKNEGFLFESHLIKKEAHTISSKILQLVQSFIKKNV